MRRGITYCILLLVGLHLTALGLAQIDGIAHFFLVTLLRTTLLLPIGSFYILNKEKKGDTVRSGIIKAITLLSVVYLSFLIDNVFNEHTDQVGRYLGKLSLLTGITVVGILIAFNLLQLLFQKKNEVQQSM
ncbi:hypothetical protein [Sabulibacter ruber]|uniref:hypothetical protein n=1 Tax=Sabulibacter ruber TaxID=2811901 RepID=UPI001A97710C|nr:hypothetical protein [Sabulibacter ruber]